MFGDVPMTSAAVAFETSAILASCAKSRRLLGTVGLVGLLLLTACGSSSGPAPMGTDGPGGGSGAAGGAWPGGASSGGASPGRAGANSGGGGHGGAADRSPSADTGVPVYQPPTWPSLPDGPCKFALAPTSSLCGGSYCPVLVDAQFGGDAVTKRLDMAATASGAAYLVFAGTYPSTASHCLFSVDRTGSSQMTLNPFAPSPSAAGMSGKAVALATDTTDGPHALIGGDSEILHFSQSGAAWTSEMLPLPSGQTGFAVSSVVSSPSGIALLVGSHPPEPGYYRSFTLQLFSGSGAGAWQTSQVLAGAGTQELMSSALSVDATGAVVATYRTRLDLSSGSLGYATYLWRGGMTSALSTPSATMDGALLQTPGDATTKDSVVRFGDSNGVQLVLPRPGDAPRALLVPGSARIPVDGCPVAGFDGGNRPLTCGGHAGKTCTLKGSTLPLTLGPQRTDDGAIWFVYTRQDIEQDVVLRDYNSGGSDALTYCAADVTADRTTSNLYIARAASADASRVELRLKVPLSSSGTPGMLESEARFLARGNRLFLAYGVRYPYRYLVLDASRL